MKNLKKFFVLLWFMIWWMLNGLMILLYTICFFIWNFSFPTSLHYRMIQMITSGEIDHAGETIYYYPDLTYWAIGKRKKMKCSKYWQMLNEFPDNIFSKTSNEQKKGGPQNV